MNVFELPDDDGAESTCRIYSGDLIESGKIVLTSSGRAFAEISPFAKLGDLRRGNRKCLPSNAVLHALLTVLIGNAADELAHRSVGPAATLTEAAEHFRDARKVEQQAVNMRMSALVLLDAPVEASRSATDFHRWFSECMSSLTPERRAGVDAASRAARKSLADGGKLGERGANLISALKTLTEYHLRPPTQAELWKELSVMRDDRKGWRDTLKVLGFDWLPSGGKGGRPGKV